MSGIDWSKKDIYEAIGRPDLKPKKGFDISISDSINAIDKEEAIKEFKRRINGESNICNYGIEAYEVVEL